MTDFGRDVWCGDSRSTGRYASGWQAMALAAYRRLTTPRGMLDGGEEEADYGLDIEEELLGEHHSDGLVASLKSKVRAELLKDERFQSVTCEITVSEEGPVVTYLVQVDAVTALGSFQIVVSVSEVTTALVGLKEAA